MPLTVDQLLAQDSSSDEDLRPLRPVAKPAATAAVASRDGGLAQSSAASSTVSAPPTAAPGSALATEDTGAVKAVARQPVTGSTDVGSAAQSSVSVPSAPPSSARSTSAGVAKQALTVDDVLAQGDSSDDDDVFAAPAAVSAPACGGNLEEVLRADNDVSDDEDARPSASRATPSAPVDDCFSDGSQVQDTPTAAGADMNRLDEFLAMIDSDDDEDASPSSAARVGASALSSAAPGSTATGSTIDGIGSIAATTGAVSAAEALVRSSSPSAEACGEEAGDAKQALACDDDGAFIQSPFEWCLEHERSLLRVDDCKGGQELGDTFGSNLGLCTSSAPGGPSGATVDMGKSSAAAAVAALAPGFTLVEARPYTELQRTLQQESGLPTCVATHANHVAVGSLRGAVVLLDPKAKVMAVGQSQVLYAPGSEDANAVTAIAFSPDGSSMLVGHKNGQLVLWELAGPKAVAVVKDVHSCAVLSVAFCRTSWQHALSADAAGNVFLVTFTAGFRGTDHKHQLLLERSSAVGVTLRILPLPQSNHPANAHCLVALCATRATVLLTLYPGVQLLQKVQYHSKDTQRSDGWVPDAVWLCPTRSPSPDAREWADSNGQQTTLSDPLLCVAFGQTVHIMRIGFDKGEAATTVKEKFKISVQNRYIWGAPIQTICAFNESVLAILDGSNKLNVVQLPSPPDVAKESPKPQQQQQLCAVHAEDVSGWSIFYHTHASEDGASGMRSHHGALAAWRGRGRNMYIVGIREVWSLQIGRWNQHVEDLVNKNSWPEALGIFLAVRRGSLPPLLDYPCDPAARQKAVDSRTAQVIQSYLSSRLQQDTPRLRARHMCHTAVGACVEMGLWSVLYKTVFECFKAAGHMNVYCSTLEPFIVNGRIPRGQMDSEVLSSILQSYSLPLEEEEQAALQHSKDQATVEGVNGSSTSKAEPSSIDCDHCPLLFPVARRLQQLVLYVDVSQLDLNLAIRLFTQHRLWTALVRVYCALRDYISPLELLVGECSQLAKRSMQQHTSTPDAGQEPHGHEVWLMRSLLTRKLFFFLRRCLEQRAFPFDGAEDCPASVVGPGPDGVAELLRCIFKSDGSDQRAPPMFVRLLRLSPFGLFGAMSALYTTPEAFETLQVLGQSSANVLDNGQKLSPAGVFRTVEAATATLMREAPQDGAPVPPNSESEFLWFVANAVPKAGVTLPTKELDRLVQHLLAAGSSNGDSSSSRLGQRPASEAEEHLLAVLAAQEPLEGPARGRLIGEATKSGFFQVASWLHETHGEYDQALDCRMRDEALCSSIFDYIVARLAAEEKSRGQSYSAALVEATMQRLPKLVAIDAERCADMICEHFASVADHDGVLNRLRLRGYPQIELKYLETLLVKRRRSHWRKPEEQREFFDGHVVRYIELLCSIEPTSVLPFLQENEAVPLRECLDLCRAHAVTDASVYLLERTGDFGEVLHLMLSGYSEALEQLHTRFMNPVGDDRAAVQRAVKQLLAAPKAQKGGGPKTKAEEKAEVSAQGDGATKSEGPWWENLPDGQRCVDLIEKAYELSSRNSNLMKAEQLEELWFGVLGHTVAAQEKVSAKAAESKRASGLALALAELASQAMTGVLAYLSLPRALKWICEKFGASALGVWKDSLQRMLSGLGFQQGLLLAAKAVAAQDVVRPFMAVKTRGSRGVRVTPDSLGTIASSTSNGALLVRLGSRCPSGGSPPNIAARAHPSR